MSYKNTPIFQDAQRTNIEEYEANSFASCLYFLLMYGINIVMY